MGFLRFFRGGASMPTAAPGRAGAAPARLPPLPPLPHTAVKAIGLAHGRDTKLDDFAELIRQDSAAAAATLKLANSALYRARHPVDGIGPAVLRIGMRGCANLLTSVGMRGLFARSDPATTRACEALWRHALFTATLAGAVNGRLGLGFGDEAFTGGLLHDLGRLALAVTAPDGFAAADPLDFDEGPGTPDRERQVLGTDHCALGADYCAENGLPPSVTCCVRHHHDPAAAPEPHARLVALVAAADHVANHVHRSHRVHDLQWSGRPELEALAAALDDEKRQRLRTTLGELVVQAMRETRSILKTYEG